MVVIFINEIDLIWLLFVCLFVGCRGWSERGGSCSSGSRSPTATFRWRCWSARRRGSTSARRSTPAATIWRRWWRRPTAPTGYACARCSWVRRHPASTSCRNTRPTRGSSRAISRHLALFIAISDDIDHLFGWEVSCNTWRLLLVRTCHYVIPCRRPAGDPVVELSSLESSTPLLGFSNRLASLHRRSSINRVCRLVS